ncbi:ABC transporter protein ATPase [Chlamydia abortus]|uniref:ABC transporter ATP-binding protein n=1 Tax=Paenibacillus sp. SAFN-117 TaxID=3436860 RepID=UPI000A27BA07|nr:ABC transporter protein ATPase [Chlamydia abortus]
MNKYDKINFSNGGREVIIRAQHLGISYMSGYRSIDYKSRVYNFLLRKTEGKDRRQIWPLRNINFEGYKGEILGVIGSNGSGKTTLCKLIAGIVKPDEGSIIVDGRVTALFSLAMGFNKEMTGRENIYLNGTMLGFGKKKIREFIEDIHNFSGIGEFFDQPVKFYSSGMKARLGFSVAAFTEPEILILDEALNTGDLAFSEKASIKMRELVTKAKMVVLVTHSLNYAKENCDRLIWIDKGVIREIGEPGDIVSHYEQTVKEKKHKKNKHGLVLQQIVTKKTDQTIINAQNISVSYKLGKNLFWALKNVSFKINEGEVVGIIGHNGAGKSTLCKILTNILLPDHGDLQIEGETTSLLGYGTGFNGELCGKDNVYLNGMLLGISKKTIDQYYTNIIDFSEIGGAIDKPVKQYSSGMKSRLGFSVAAFLNPDVFIIDEALSAGDMAFNQKASEKIQEMISKAKAVIVVSHSMGFIEKVCTRAIWLDKGEIIFDGPTKEVVKKYKTVTKSKLKTSL